MSFVGQKVGRIRVTEVLGRGGMGEVYAGLDETLGRRVALKALRGEFRLDADARGRFVREARILSQLQHANICQLYDYIEGEDDDFLVLELIEGETLSQVLARGSMPTRDRLALTEKIVDVLAAAHARGIIHRDLKPANVMLTAAGEVKVLDFGLARALDATDTTPTRILPPSDVAGGATTIQAKATSDADDTVATVPDAESQPGSEVQTTYGSVMGTVGYMSPEQARGESVTTASDMYSFGLILQELCTGEAAQEDSLPRRERLQRAARGETRALTAGVDGDLAALIERLQANAPGVRPSALDAAARLRWIAEKPRRRLRKWATVAAFVFLLSIAAVMSYQARRIGREVERANQEAETAKGVSEFLVGLFSLSDPSQALGNTITAREVLDRGAERVRRELADQPYIRGRLLHTMGTTYRGLGLPEPASELLREAVAIRESVLGVEHPEVAASLNSLAATLYDRGEYAAAEPIFGRVLSIRERVFGAEHPEVANVLDNLAASQVSQGRYDESEPLRRRALAIRERSLGAEHSEVAKSLNNLANLHRIRGEYARAVELLGRALAIWEKELGSRHPLVATAMHNVGINLFLLDRHEEAAPWIERALEIRRDILGPEHPEVLSTLIMQAELLRVGGSLDEARTVYRDLLPRLEATLGAEHLWFSGALYNLGLAEMTMGEGVQARRHLERSLELRERALGEDHPSVAETLNGLGELDLLERRAQDAEARFQRSRRILAATFGARHVALTVPLHGLANIYRDQGRRAEAEALYALAMELRQAALPADHPDVLRLRRDYEQLAEASQESGSPP